MNNSDIPIIIGCDHAAYPLKEKVKNYLVDLNLNNPLLVLCEMDKILRDYWQYYVFPFYLHLERYKEDVANLRKVSMHYAMIKVYDSIFEKLSSIDKKKIIFQGDYHEVHNEVDKIEELDVLWEWLAPKCM